MSEIESLHVFAAGKWMGRIDRNRKQNRLSFHYEKEWRSDRNAFPLSLSMPLAAIEHGHDAVESFIWGLLPDNEGVLRRWGQKFQVSSRNPFHLLWHVGEECAGAIQFIRPDRVEEWSGSSLPGDIAWLSPEEIGERIRLLLADHSAIRMATDTGYFSLAGAQPKTAFYYDPEKDRWGVPSGTVPTTHIFKPAAETFDGFAENEHFCMRLARELGLSTASSSVQYFSDQPVIVVERYDRTRTSDGVVRIHQEDMCQALACPPQQKYQASGGPSPADIIGLIRQYSADHLMDEGRFIDALAYNWLIGGTDAHAKNYGFLIAPGGGVRMAPLYDLSSALPYPKQVDLRRAGLAMKIGGAYKLREINRAQWLKFADEIHADSDALIGRVRLLAEILPDVVSRVGSELRGQGMKHKVIAHLMEELAVRSRACQKALI